jgi:hypothetical protein
VNYFEQFKREMEQLFGKIDAKENETRRKIEQYEEKIKLKVFQAGLKNLLQHCEFINSKVDVDFGEIVRTKMDAVKLDETKEKTN